MPTTVPPRFSFPARTGIASGKPIRAHQIRSIGEGLVYLRGHSRVLIPCTALDYALPASTTHTYTIPVQRTSWMRHLEWRFSLRSTSATATVVFTDPTGGISTHTVSPSDADVLPRVTWRQHTETLSGTTDTDDLAVARTSSAARRRRRQRGGASRRPATRRLVMCAAWRARASLTRRPTSTVWRSPRSRSVSGTTAAVRAPPTSRSRDCASCLWTDHARRA